MLQVIYGQSAEPSQLGRGGVTYTLSHPYNNSGLCTFSTFYFTNYSTFSICTYLLRFKCTPSWRQPDSRQQMLLILFVLTTRFADTWSITKYNLYNITSRSFYKFVFKYCKFSFQLSTNPVVENGKYSTFIESFSSIIFLFGD